MSFEFIPGKQVDVPQISYKDEIILSARKSALLIIDMQNDFVSPNGNLSVPSARETVADIKKLRESARESAAHVAYTKDTHYPNDREWELWPKHCERGSWGWEITEELAPADDEMVFEKNRYDGFYGSALEHYLSRVWQVDHLVLAGTVANICVAHTAASAGLRWFHIVVPANGISALNTFDQALTLRQASSLYAGNVVKSVEDIKFE